MLLMRTLLKEADLVLTHARDGIEFARELVPDSTTKIHFLHHPAPQPEPNFRQPAEASCDVLIWGGMQAYKGVREFLECLSTRAPSVQFKTLVWGKFSSNDYYEECRKFESDKIEIRNEFISDGELAIAQRSTRIILFPYRTMTILSSGALMDSLTSPAAIIGPNAGAFEDLKEEGCVETYRDWNDAVDIIERTLESEYDPEPVLRRREEFCKAHSWDLTTDRINQLLLSRLGAGATSMTSSPRVVDNVQS
jgi:glycosyltransferase involved in cell wall biosynthesis